MSSKDGFKPWYMSTTPYVNERQEFITGVGKSTFGNALLFAIVAGYVGGKVAQRTGNKK